MIELDRFKGRQFSGFEIIHYWIRTIDLPAGIHDHKTIETIKELINNEDDRQKEADRLVIHHDYRMPLTDEVYIAACYMALAMMKVS